FSGNIVGDISNSGFITATSTATNSGLFAFGSAFAAGIHIGGLTSDFHNHAQSGFFFGNVSNAGTIVALATALNTTPFDGILEAPEAYAAGIQVDAFAMIGNINNASKGMIAAEAFASGAGMASASANGIFMQGSLFAGHVTNEGTVVATSTALNTPEEFAFAA